MNASISRQDPAMETIVNNGDVGRVPKRIDSMGVRLLKVYSRKRRPSW